MKQTILEIIGKARNKKTHVFNIKGERVPVAKMEEDTFYCFNLNTLGSDRNIDTWNKYIDSNKKTPPAAPKAPEAPITPEVVEVVKAPIVKRAVKKVVKKSVKKASKKVVKKAVKKAEG